MPDRITDSMNRSAHALLVSLLLCAGCASITAPAPIPVPGAGPDPTPFSTAAALDQLPEGWKPYRLARFKRFTEWRLVPKDGKVTMQATARASASGLQYFTQVDLREFPYLTWAWNVPNAIENSGNSIHRIVDTPARVIVTFEGGRDDLPAADQMTYDLALAIAGSELPFATIMYVWEPGVPPGTVIEHHLSGRVKMIVMGGPSYRLGAWDQEVANVLDDYRRLFDAEPPKVKTVGIMSDSDNTGATAVAFFGDIHFLRSPPIKLGSDTHER
jgi:Protein of unknown function (DUF3047)